MLKGYIRAISHPIRQRIIQLLQENGEMNVTDIYVKLRGDQPTTSRHIKILSKSNILSSQRQGKYKYYSINNPFFQSMESKIEELQTFMSNETI